MKIKFLGLLFLVFSLSSCYFNTKSKCEPDLCDIVNSKEKIELVKLAGAPELGDTSRSELLHKFPFISYRPILDFNGNFPPEFYSSIKEKWNAVPFDKANYWRLRWDKKYYDVVYLKPLWIGNIRFESGDLLKDLAFSMNVSPEKIRILKDWIKSGGVLWIESAIYISTYDISLGKLKKKDIVNLVEALKKTKLFNKNLNVFIIRARKIDKFHTKPVLKVVKVDNKPSFLRDINKLLLRQDDYIGIYFTLKGIPLVKNGRLVYASYVNYGKGRIITTVPFDFVNSYYDGELYRWELLLWAISNHVR